MTPANVTEAIARHVACTPFSALPPATIDVTTRSLLDGIGVMLAASGMCREVDPFVTLARGMGAHDGRASILGHWDRVSAPAAAFANGAMAHALDYEDAFDAAPGHPNASLIPAAFATAQTFAPVNGETFITAMAVGCDLACRLALSAGAGLEEGGWYPPPIFGAFGATAAVARLLGLSPREVSDAFSILLCQNTCPGEIKYTGASPIRAVREAFPAQAAVISAVLAKQGISGFAQPFEGRAGFFRLFAGGRFDQRALLDGLGERFHGERVSFKPWPCCRGTHAYIHAARMLRAKYQFDAASIVSVRLTTGTVQRMLSEPLELKRAPPTAIDAKFSLPFTVASAFLQPDVTLDSFSERALADPATRALARRMHIEPRADWGVEKATAGALEVELASGARFQHEVLQAPGHPDAPLDLDILRAKFVDCATRGARPCSREQAEIFAARILSLAAAPDVNVWLAPVPGLDANPESV
jgi:2-methylcitrate dehydratase PrpD